MVKPPTEPLIGRPACNTKSRGSAPTRSKVWEMIEISLPATQIIETTPSYKDGHKERALRENNLTHGDVVSVAIPSSAFRTACRFSLPVEDLCRSIRLCYIQPQIWDAIPQSQENDFAEPASNTMLMTKLPRNERPQKSIKQ